MSGEREEGKTRRPGGGRDRGCHPLAREGRMRARSWVEVRRPGASNAGTENWGTV